MLDRLRVLRWKTEITLREDRNELLIVSEELVGCLKATMCLAVALCEMLRCT